RRPPPAWLLSTLGRPEDGLGWLPAPLADVVLRQAALWPPPATAPPYASWGRRLAAALLDGLFVVPPILCYFAYLFAVVWARENITALNRGVAISTTRATIPIVAFICLITFFVLLVRTLVREGRTGQSPGKRILQIELLDARTGRPVGVGRALVRRLAHVLDSLPCHLGFLWPLWDAEHQTFADKLVHTVVLDRPGRGPAMGG
ncbi:RDD family protein, partial [Actinoallomurus acaciae]